MKIKEEIQKVYVAFDDTKFEDEASCAAYEEEITLKMNFDTLQAKVDKIECIECGEAPFSLCYVDDDRYEYRWYRPKNIEEVSALNDFFRISLEASEMVGEWVCIEIDGGYDDYTGVEDVYITIDFDVSNEHIVNFYKQLGYDVEIKKEPSAVKIRDDAVEKLWEQLDDIPMDPKTECIEQPFCHFPAGTNKYDIWEWFGAQHSKGIDALIGK